MKYVTTNIRLPEDLWKALKSEAAQQKRRFTELVRDYLSSSLSTRKKKSHRKPRSLCGIWKGVNITDTDIEEAKRSLFPPPEKFLSK